MPPNGSAKDLVVASHKDAWNKKAILFSIFNTKGTVNENMFNELISIK